MKTKRELRDMLLACIKEANREKDQQGLTNYYFMLRGKIALLREIINC